MFYHLLLNLTIYSNTWLHLLKYCLLITWRIFTTNFIFKDVVKKWNWWFFIIDEEDRQLTRIHCCPKATKICLLDSYFSFPSKRLVKILWNWQSVLNFFAYKWQLKGTYKRLYLRPNKWQPGLPDYKGVGVIGSESSELLISLEYVKVHVCWIIQ